METSVSIPKWLSYFSCHRCQITHTGFMIPKVWVESTNLTASYYREYLGFKIVFRNPFNKNGSILIKRKSNWVLIKTISSEISANNQRLTIYLSRIEKEYFRICSMVWVVKPYNLGSKKMFLIKDCNGMEIVYRKS